MGRTDVFEFVFQSATDLIIENARPLTVWKSPFDILFDSFAITSGHALFSLLSIACFNIHGVIC